MKRLRVSSKIWLALAASTALGFGQMTGLQPSIRSLQDPQNGVYASAPGQRGMIPPGTVNYTEGQVSLDGRQIGNQQPGYQQGARGLVVLQPGQTLDTGSGFAEVLLTPGSFLRMGHNSQVRMVAAGLADTKAQLDQGTALVEVDQFVQGTNLTVAMNNATVKLEKKGLYDFDAGEQTVKVLDGKANVLEAAGSKTIGKDDELRLASEKPLKKMSFEASLVKAQPLYVWSEVRSQDESQANVSLAENVATYGGWYGPGWYFDPAWSFYSYLPGDGFLYSPFGLGFYSPAFIGYYGIPFGYYHRYGGYGGWHVGGASAHISGFNRGFSGGGFHSSGFSGGGFHSGGFSGGGFHGGGGRR
jgi:hypothetical protein